MFLVSFITPFFFVYAGLLLDPWSILLAISLKKVLLAALSIVIAGIVG